MTRRASRRGRARRGSAEVLLHSIDDVRAAVGREDLPGLEDALQSSAEWDVAIDIADDGLAVRIGPIGTWLE